MSSGHSPAVSASSSSSENDVRETTPQSDLGAGGPARLASRLRRPRRRAVRIVLFVLFAAVTLIWSYPLIWAVTASLKTDSEVVTGSASLLPEAFKFSDLITGNWSAVASAFNVENYSDAWYVASFAKYFANSVIVTVSVVGLVVMMTCLAGYVLGRYSFPGKAVFIGAATILVFLPEGYTIVPIWYLINVLGLSESLLGLILAMSGTAHLFYILLLAAFFRGLPKELEEAAVVDGAGFFRVFSKVMLPLAKPAIATVVILEFIAAWNNFFLPLVFTAGKPNLQTISVGLYTSFVNEYTVSFATMAAGVVIAFTPVIIVFLFFQRYFVEGIAGAVK